MQRRQLVSLLPRAAAIAAVPALAPAFVRNAFADEAGRQAHLNGQIAAALMANAATLLSSPPNIEKVELLAAKLPA